MEGVVKQWKVEEEEEAEAQVEEAGLFRSQAHQQVTTFSITSTSLIDVQGQEISETKCDSNGIEKKSTTSTSSDPIILGDFTPLYNVTIESENWQEISETKDIEKKSTTLPSSDTVMSRDLTSLHNVTIESEKRQEISETKDNPSSSDIEKKKIITLPSSDLVISRDLTSLNNVTTESERVGVITENIQDAKELYLESLYQKPHTQGFYCPKCRACIDKVLILDQVRQEPDDPFERFRCSTCFSFIIPIGSWVVPWWPRGKGEIPEDPQKTKVPAMGGPTWSAPGAAAPPDFQKNRVLGPPVVPAPHQVSPDSRDQQLQHEPSITDDACKTQDGSPSSQQPGGGSSVSSGASTDQQHKAIGIPGEQSPDVSTAKRSHWGLLASASEDDVRDGVSTGSSKTWDILKSIVYGGLVESIASLGIVASSASADATTLSILALSLANLIGGLFTLVHHIWDLKSEKQSTNEIVDRYYLSLGKRENFYLHVCIAILSFLIFGVVPPLVYGLTFYETNYKDLALVAVAGASIICITLLSIAKVYIQRPNTYLTYLKTVLYYLCTGALTSVIAYLVGVLVRELLEKSGLSSESSLGFNLMLPQMSVIEKPRFGSY